MPPLPPVAPRGAAVVGPAGDPRDLATGPGPGGASPNDPSAATPGSGAIDLLDVICPYLLSEDGSYRSAEPDPGHRCTAQDPPGTLPLAFQERFCLTDQHVRCEMYKDASAARAAALELEGIPPGQVQAARFRPAVRSIPLAVGPAGPGRQDARPGSRGLVIIVAIGIALVAAFVFLLVLALGRGEESGAGVDPSSSPRATLPASATATPRATPGGRATAPATAMASTPPGASPTASAAPGSSLPLGSSLPVGSTDRRIEYQVQEGEALLKIAVTFGTTRRAIIRANEGMADLKPYTQPGDIILVPVALELSDEFVATVPGFIRFVE
jgi:hypothetical protein